MVVASQFLRPVEETIYLNKSRKIEESTILQKSVDRLNFKLKQLREKEEDPRDVLCNADLIDQKTYNSTSSYEPIGTIRLPKGTYLITISFLLKATNQWLYIYLNQTQMMQNCGFYVPNNGNFIPYTVKKMHTVNAS